MFEKGPKKGVARRIINSLTRASSGEIKTELLSNKERRGGMLMKKKVGRVQWEKMQEKLAEIDAITAISREKLNPRNVVIFPFWGKDAVSIPPETVQSAIERIEDVQREDLGPDYVGPLPIPSGEQISRARLYARTEALMTLIDWGVDDHVTVSRSGYDMPCKLEAKDNKYELFEDPRVEDLPEVGQKVVEMTLVVRKKPVRPTVSSLEPVSVYPMPDE